MSASAIPPSLKPVVPYFKRAEELDQDRVNPDSKVVAYFCRSYAVKEALSLRTDANKAEITPFLMFYLDKLEKDKASIGESANLENGRIICENFAYTVFKKADDEDRGGIADRNTAKTFYAASSFLDIMSQFGALDEEMQEKQRYSKWKAADILKAIKEGRKPAAGSVDDRAVQSDSEPFPHPASQQSSQSISAIPLVNYSSVAHEVGYPYILPNHPGQSGVADLNSAFPAQNALPPATILMPSTAITQISALPLSPPLSSSSLSPIPAPTSSSVSSSIFTVFSTSTEKSNPAPQKAMIGSNDPRIKDAIELSQFAIASLKHNNIQQARERLHEALKRIDF